MRIVVIDFETYWDQTHTLSKMSPIEYCASPKTQVISLGIKVDNYPTDVLFGEDKIRRVCDKLDWSNALVVGHNMSGFDAMLLAWRFGVRPRMWGCTLSMARPLHSKTVGNSLGKLVEHYGIGVKNQAVLVQTKGKRLEDFTREELDAMAEYNRADVEQCRALFDKLRPHYTAKELWHIDATIRMLIEPKFQVDKALLETALSVERDHKRRAILTVARHLKRNSMASEELETCTTLDDLEEAVRKDLASAPRFAKLLESLGVEVPMKPSPTDPKKEVPALAKTDEAFLALQEHEDEVVAAAARARLAVKSTLLETRIQAFLDASDTVGGYLPVPLNYCGADTTGRWSGWAYNCFLGDTEVLTEQGWVRFDAWRGEPIAQWWPDGSITMEYNPGVLAKPYAGPVVDIESRCVSSTMTPDHRLVSCPPTKSGIKERTAGWVAEHSGLDNIPAAGIWVGVSDSVMTPELVRLAVAFSADGCVVGDTIQVGLRRERKITRMRELLEAAGVPYRIREYSTQEGHKGAHNTVVFVIKNPPVGKGFGPWILRLSREALNALVSELVHWDGQPHHKSGRLCFWTTQRSDAEWVQTALALSGVVSTIREYPSRNPAHKPKLLVYARKEPYTSIDTARDVTVREHEGLVYCASVESSYILIRRNSKISVVGQCQNLPRITPGKPKPSDALRKCLRAPRGYKVVVADQSGIELRVNHFLWQVPSSTELYRQDRKADLYRAFAAARYGIKPEEVSKDQRQLAKVAQLGLGFGAGWRTFQKVAKLMGGLELSDEEAETVTTSWRTQYIEIVQGWRTCHAALQSIYDGEERPIDPWGLCKTTSEGIVLPSGRVIRYPTLHQETNDEGKTEWWYGTGRHRARIYAGKVTENCLAEGTLVLTESGWKSIELVSLDDRVHDGVEFVNHAGVVFKSVQPCIALDGVYMTPDHEVLTDDGWKEASQVQRPYRPDLRGVDRFAPGSAHGQVVEVALPVPVRTACCKTGVGRDKGDQARRHAKLRVPDPATDVQGEHQARDEQTPRLRRLALYAGSVQTAVAQGVQKLRRAGDHGLRAVAGVVRQLLVGHGAYVPAWAGPGPDRQQRPIFTGELPVGGSSNQHHEQAGVRSVGGHPSVERGYWDQSQHALQPPEIGLVSGGANSPTLAWKPVYDILNCGPRHRFVVKGLDGPMVVHNCVQALARDIIADNAVEFFRATGFRPSLMVHDELVYVVPESEAADALATLQGIMRTPPKWWPELITESEGDIADTYGDAK